jgi:hypothetical protein
MTDRPLEGRPARQHRTPKGRRPRAIGAAGCSPRRALVVAAAALVLAALLDAEALEDTASSQPFGWRHDVATAVVDPVLAVSRALHLTAPRRWLEDAFDRPHTRPEPPATTVPTTAPPTTGTAPTTAPPTTAPPQRRVPTAGDPLRLLIAGDSMTESLGPVLLEAADATGVIDGERELRYSSGLTRPDYFDWPAFLTDLLERDDPEAVVIMLGANDAQGIMTPDGAAAFGTDPWIAEYRKRVAAVMAVLTGGDRTVYWIGQPIMRSSDFDERMRLLTDIYRTEAARHPAIRFVDTRALFARDGAYSDYLPGADGTPVLVRRDDGIHLTPAGAERLAEVLMRAIGDDWDLEEA